MSSRRLSTVSVAVVATLICLCLGIVSGVDRSKFRTCAQTHFCSKYRLAKGIQKYELLGDTLMVNADSVHFELRDALVPDTMHVPNRLLGSLQFVLDPQQSAYPAVRVHVSEKLTDPNDPKKRWENPDVLTKEATMLRPLRQVQATEAGLHVAEGALCFTPASADVDLVVVVQKQPFAIDVYLNKKKVMGTNTADQFHYEIRQDRVTTEVSSDNVETTEAEAEKDVHGGKTIVDYGEDGLAIYSDGTVQQKADVQEAPVAPALNDPTEGWEESFGGHTDKKKFGPSSIGLDISFFGTSRGVYGIPEHASDFHLKNTIQRNGVGEQHVLTDPYRLYNLDVFEYELDETMTLYGSIPVMVAPNAENTVGVFWHNPSETFVDIETVNEEEKRSHWMSESGVLDLFFLVGSKPSDFFSQYTSLTGRAQFPPAFALGYHQCRWNYKNEADVDRVDAGFDEHLIPYDVLWLDIEHTNGKRYFTWDAHAFPNPLPMQDRVARSGRKMVTIVDPHIKRDDNYYVHQEATAKGMYIKDEGGKDFNGWCWPGDSSYVDFTSKDARLWWASLFRYEKYQQSSKHLFTWNDMNEPSVFNGPEVSMRKTCLNLEGVEHREWHNMYGYYMQWATMDGQMIRQLPEGTTEISAQSSMQRPFVLSRAFFAGSQRFGAIWTGDNKADWGHLAYATKMLLSMSVTGLTFVGADVGGFFGNPDAELVTRWYQAAVFQPFFRGHAHHDSSRREPWVFGEPHTARIRSAIRLRYAFLPYVYTLFHECSSDGQPVMRPLWMRFPEVIGMTAEENQFMLGDDLLIKPITEPEAARTEVYLPGSGLIWYHIFEGFKRFGGGKLHEGLPTPIDYIPVFQRGGSIIPRKNRVRRSAQLMKRDPVTLVIALDVDRKATGSLYIDDEETYAFSTEDRFGKVTYTWSDFVLKSSLVANSFASESWVERIEVYGLQDQGEQIASVNLGDQELLFQYNAENDLLIVRKPGVIALSNWEIHFSR